MMNRKLLSLSCIACSFEPDLNLTQRLSLEVVLTAREERRQNEVQLPAFSEKKQSPDSRRRLSIVSFNPYKMAPF